MFPNAEFLSLDLYYWMILVGVIAAMVSFRIFHARIGMSVKVFNLALGVAVPGIILGYLSAVLFQSWFSYLETGEFVWGVGATFYGGLIGAAAVYLSLYFLIGHFLFKDRAHVTEFIKVMSLAIPSIVVAHAFGRLGCLFDGCCYGRLTDGPFGIEMWVHGEWQRRIPLQLFESLFLFALYALLIFLLVKRKCEYTATIYLVVYGVWRFCIEYARDDDRGASGIGFLSPAQLTAIVLILVGVGVWFLCKYVLIKAYARAHTSAEEPEKTE